MIPNELKGELVKTIEVTKEFAIRIYARPGHAVVELVEYGYPLDYGTDSIRPAELPANICVFEVVKKVWPWSKKPAPFCKRLDDAVDKLEELAFQILFRRISREASEDRMARLIEGCRGQS